MQQEELKEKNSNLSVLLIIVNLVLVWIFFSLIPKSEDESIMGMYFTGVAFVVLQGIYAFGYRYLAAKWFFGISLVILLIFTGLLWYVAQLGKAFQH